MIHCSGIITSKGFSIAYFICRMLNFQRFLNRYTNADLKIWHYLLLHIKIICGRFHIKTPFTLWDIRSWVMWEVCLETYSNNRKCQKLACFLRNLQTSQANNSIILRTINVNFPEYCFYMKHTSRKIWPKCNMPNET